MYSIADIGKIKKQIKWIVGQLNCLRDRGCLCYALNTDLTYNEETGELSSTYIDGTTQNTPLNIPRNTSDINNDSGFITIDDVTNLAEYTLSPISGSNEVQLLKDGVAVSTIDLTPYLDDTNLARLTSGVVDNITGIATFQRDDASTFTVDFSSLIDLQPTNTSELVNDGENGNDPFITLNEVPQYTFSPISGTNQVNLLRDGVVVSNLDLSPYLDDTNLARLVSGVLNGNTGIATFTRDDSSTFTVDLSSLVIETPNFATAKVINTISSGFANMTTILDAEVPLTLDPFYIAEVDGDTYLIYDQDQDLYTIDPNARNKVVFINESNQRVSEALSAEDDTVSTSRYKVFPFDFGEIIVGPDFVVGNTYKFNYFQTKVLIEAINGLNLSPQGEIRLGGDLTQSTNIGLNGFGLSLTGNGSSYNLFSNFANLQSAGVFVMSSGGNFVITANDELILTGIEGVGIKTQNNITNVINDNITAKESGLVGINTTAPSSNLDINGDIRIRQIPLSLSGESELTVDSDGNLKKYSNSDYTPLTLSAGGATIVQYKRENNKVYITFFNFNSVTPGTNFGILPLGFRPSINTHCGYVWGTGGISNKVGIIVGAAGNLQVDSNMIGFYAGGVCFDLNY